MLFWTKLKQIHVSVSKFTFLYPDSRSCIQIHMSVSKFTFLYPKLYCCVQIHHFVSGLNVESQIHVSVFKFMILYPDSRFIFLYPYSRFCLYPDSCWVTNSYFCIQNHYSISRVQTHVSVSKFTMGPYRLIAPVLGIWCLRSLTLYLDLERLPLDPGPWPFNPRPQTFHPWP